MKKVIRIFLAAACAAMLAGCETLSYYTQAMGGQFSITTRAREVDQVMDDPATTTDLRDRLRTALEIREFATKELGLPDDGSYRRYADLKRPYVVWNLFVTPEFSTKAVESCFPVTGCVSYRGYFAEADAHAYAEKMRAKGYDVQVSGIPAYSTLGWFDDPLLSTFIRYPQSELARLVFHELAHHVVYIKGDTVFNESFAVAVEGAGVRRWLSVKKNDLDIPTFLAARGRQREFIALIEAAKERLDRIYKSGKPPAELREAKRAGFEELMRDYAGLKRRWGGFSGYDRIIGATPGNALLASITAYSKYVPGFERILDAGGGSLPHFYETVKKLSKLSKQERCRILTTAPSSTSEEC